MKALFLDLTPEEFTDIKRGLEACSLPFEANGQQVEVTSIEAIRVTAWALETQGGTLRPKVYREEAS